jgi:hypothetical protein
VAFPQFFLISLATFHRHSSIYSDNSRNTGRFSANSAAFYTGCSFKSSSSNSTIPHLFPTQISRPRCVQSVGLWFRSQRVDFCCHDEVVSVEPMNRVRPESHRHSPPFGENRRMMTFNLGERTHAIRKA